MLQLVLKSKKRLHYAEAIMDDKTFIVKAGAIINPVNAFPQMSKEIVAMRKDRAIVSEDGRLLKDMTFNSPSTAAQFVTGRSVNGYIAWRPNDEMSLKAYLEQRR